MRSTRYMGAAVAAAVALIASVQVLHARHAVRPNSPPVNWQQADDPDHLAVRALEHRVEAAFQQGDRAFLTTVLADDFRFTHGTGVVADKASTLADFVQPRRFVSRTIAALEVEVHGDVSLTSGRIEIRSSAPRDYAVCYIRVYQRRSSRWQLISHRTFREQEGFAGTCAPK